MNTQFLIVDPQEDFCNQETGTLKVNGADQDMVRLARLIEKLNNDNKIDDIIVTMDSHSEVHIAHPISWVDKAVKSSS